MIVPLMMILQAIIVVFLFSRKVYAEVREKEIPITKISPVRIGQVENTGAATGCTVLICENGMRAGLADWMSGAEAPRPVRASCSIL